MCLSPEDMTIEQLEKQVSTMKKYLKKYIADEYVDSYYKKLYENRLVQFTTLLEKRKAEAGLMIDGS